MDSHSFQWSQNVPAPSPSPEQGKWHDKGYLRRRDGIRHRPEKKATFLASLKAETLAYLAINFLNFLDALLTLRLVAFCGWGAEASPLMHLLGVQLGVTLWFKGKMLIVWLLTSFLYFMKGAYLKWVLLPFMAVVLWHLVTF